MLQIRDILIKSDKLRTSAKNNTQKDFEFSYFDAIDDALIEGLPQNQDFFSLLLSNDELKREVLDIFPDKIYKEGLIKSKCVYGRENFAPGEAKNRRNTLCISRFFNEAGHKIGPWAGLRPA